MTHPDETTFDEAEQLTLDDIGQRLRADGWGDHVSVGWLLKAWRDLATEVNGYAATVDDYTNDLVTRDGLEIVLAECQEPLRCKLQARIERLDEEFLRQTEADNEDRLGRYYQVDQKSGWWWKRRPIKGPLADYLTEFVA